MIEKSSYTVALLIALVVLAKSIAVLLGSGGDTDLLRGGMLANIVDLVAAAALTVFAVLSLSSSVSWIQIRSSAVVMLALLAVGLIVHLAYAVAYPDVRMDFVVGVFIYAVAGSLVVVARRRQLFATSQ